MNPKLRNLLTALREQTDNGNVGWAFVDDDTFRAAVGGGLVRVGRGRRRVSVDDDTEEYVGTYWVVVSNPNGRVVEEAELIEGESGYSLTDGVFRAARAAALDSDRVLDEMVRSLTDHKP